MACNHKVPPQNFALARFMVDEFISSNKHVLEGQRRVFLSYKVLDTRGSLLAISHPYALI